jgi:outer membrane protein assembly factor BamD (BamD/ComL family)
MISRFRTPRLVLAGLVLAAAVAAPHAFAADSKSDSKNEDKIRAELAKPMTDAQQALQQKNWSEAMAKLAEADAAKDKTPYEIYMINRMRGVAANGSGDMAGASKYFGAAIDTGKMLPQEQQDLEADLVQAFIRAKDYPDMAAWAQRYIKSGGTSQSVRSALALAEFNTGDVAGAARDLQAQIAAAEQAGQKPPEQPLTLLANCYDKQKDEANYMRAVEKLVTDYPKPEYWVSLLSHVTGNARLSDQLLVNVERLQRATGALTSSNQYAMMVDLDLAEGISSEAKSVADEGAGKGLVPKATQAKADAAAAQDRAKLDRDAKDAETFKDGNVLASIGYTYVGFGDYTKGIAAMQQAIAKGGLKHPEETKIELGIAYYQAGQFPKAVETFNGITGSGQAAQVARYWAIKAKQGA